MYFPFVLEKLVLAVFTKTTESHGTQSSKYHLHLWLNEFSFMTICYAQDSEDIGLTVALWKSTYLTTTA